MYSLLRLFCVIIFLISTYPIALTRADSPFSLTPRLAWFESASTNNGKRRFLAVGNFLDTTNSALYANAKSFLEFDLSSLAGNKLIAAKLKLFKYASSTTGDFQAELFSESKSIGIVKVAPGNYDYAELAFDILPLLKNPGAAIKLELRGKSYGPQEGLALCSGNIEDNVCPRKFFPLLELSMEPNKQGTLAELNYSVPTQLNSTAKSPYFSCKEGGGCKLNIGWRYNDEDNNSQVRARAKFNDGVIFSDWKSANSAVQSTLDLKDGAYKIELEIRDGISTTFRELGALEIDTLPPSKPVVLVHSGYGSKSGVRIVLLPNIDAKEYHLVVCKSLSAGDCTSPKYSENYADPNLVFKSPVPLKDGEKYYYLISQSDALGNKSAKLALALFQRNMQVVLEQLKLTVSRLSPANKDKHFDTAGLSFKQNSQLKLMQLSVFTRLGAKVLTTTKFPVSKREFMLNQLLAKLKDGNYFLVVAGEDVDGYAIAAEKVLNFSIDNTPPRLY